jgi:hypothetical protein
MPISEELKNALTGNPKNFLAIDLGQDRKVWNEALNFAAEENHLEIFDRLIFLTPQNLISEFIHNNSEMPFMSATQNGHSDIALKIIDLTTQPSDLRKMVANNHHEAFTNCVANGNIEIFNRLIEVYKDQAELLVTSLNKENWTGEEDLIEEVTSFFDGVDWSTEFSHAPENVSMERKSQEIFEEFIHRNKCSWIASAAERENSDFVNRFFELTTTDRFRDNAATKAFQTAQQDSMSSVNYFILESAINASPSQYCRRNMIHSNNDKAFANKPIANFLAIILGDGICRTENHPNNFNKEKITNLRKIQTTREIYQTKLLNLLKIKILYQFV